MTDQELVQKIIAGDEWAFKELLQKYQSIVFRTCIGFLHNKEEAEDLTQDVFIEVFQSIDKFRHEAKISTWLYRVSVNKSLNYIKKNQKNKLLLSLENIFSIGKNEQRIELMNKSVSENSMERDERNIMLKKAIDSLPSNQKIAFTLNKYDELSYNDISEVMDVSVSAVESLIHRAKLNLQNKLIGYFKK